jgi:endonuclease/exonuclease/phosphatase family metal-dependent hydrolase
LVLVLAIVVVAAGWSVAARAEPGAASAPTTGARLRGDGTIELSVMTYNIRQGGVHGPWRKTVEAVRASGADVVGLQEPFGRTRKLARSLGWYAAPRLHTISRFPILEPPGSDGLWGWLLVAPGKVVTIANVHNPSWPNSVDLLRTGSATRQEVMRIERRYRLRWMRPFLQSLAPQLEGGAPVFFTGDFNSPSWRDWTREVVRAQGWQPPTVRSFAPRIPIRWPVSVKMEASGFRDTYREVHPDAIAQPGFTWTSGHPGISSWDVFDRIDFVWAAGPAETLDSRIVGDDDPVSDVVVEPWPSDHRAVVSTFRVTPGDAPAFAAPVDVRVPIGRDVEVVFVDAPAAGRSVGLWAPGDDPASDAPAVSAPIADADPSGTVTLATDYLEPGLYTTAVHRTGTTPLVGGTVALVDPGAPATIEVSSQTFAVGEPIIVTWTNAPGNRYDWLDVHGAAATPTTGRIWNWRYLGARVFGTTAVKAEATGNWPLPPGRYRVSLCVDDDFVCLATTQAFRIVGS